MTTMIALTSGRSVAVKGPPEDIERRLRQVGDYTATEGRASDTDHFPDSYLIFVGFEQFERASDRSPVFVRPAKVEAIYAYESDDDEGMGTEPEYTLSWRFVLSVLAVIAVCVVVVALSVA